MDRYLIIGVCLMFAVSNGNGDQNLTSPSYLIYVPRLVQHGIPTPLSVTVFIDGPVFVTAEILTENATVVRAEGNFQKGQTGLQTLPPILDFPFRTYRLTLVVNGFVGENMVFTNRTYINYRRLSFAGTIQTDKKRYTPGEMVKFRVITADHEGKPSKGPVNIQIRDPKRIMVKEWLNVDSFLGVASREFQLSDNPHFGTWTISASGNNVQAMGSFTVERHAPHKVELSLNVPSVILYGDDLMGTVDIRYRNGLATEGMLALTLSYGDRSVVKNKKITGSADFVYSKQDFSEGLKLNFQNLEVMNQRFNLRVTAVVTDTITGVKHTTNAVVKMVTQKYNLTFFNFPGLLKPSLHVSSQLKVTRYDGKPLTPIDRMNNVNITVTQQRQGPLIEGGILLNGMGSGDSSLTLSLTVPQDGVVDFQFQLLDDVFSVRMEARFHNVMTTTLRRGFHPSPSNSYIQIQKPSSLLAQAGVPLQLSIESSFELTQIHYLVLSRGKLVAAGTKTVTSKSFSLTPEESWVPDAQLMVYSVLPDGEVIGEAVHFPVTQPPKINVSLSWSPDRVKPEGEVSLAVTVTEPEVLVGIRASDSPPDCTDGNWFNEKLLVQTFQGSLFRILGGSYSSFPSYHVVVLTDTNFPKMYRGPESFVRPFAIEGEDWFLPEGEGPFAIEGEDWFLPEGEGDVVFGPDEDAHYNLLQCRAPSETWLWLETNMSESTTKSLHFTVPDRMTSWFAYAFVVSENTGFGYTHIPAQLDVSKDFYLFLELPPFIIRGELLVMELHLFNNLDQELEFMVMVDPNEAFEFVYPDKSSPTYRPRKVKVGKKNSTVVLIPIRPKVLGLTFVNAHAVSVDSEHQDNITRKVLVKSEGIEKSYTKSLFLELAPNEQSRWWEVIFTFPVNVVPDTRRIEVVIVGNILGPSIAGLEVLIKLPYGCGEQNMINFAPNIYILQYLTTVNNVEESIRSKSISFMVKGYERELSYQRSDGSFSAFGDRDKSGSTWLSAFVLRCFLQARQFISIDAAVISRTASWLVDQQKPDGSFNEPGRVIHTELQGGLDSSISLTAYTLMALLEDETYKDKYNNVVSKALVFLEAKLEEGISSNYSLCLVTYALSLAQRPSAPTALEELISRADVNDGVLSWSSADTGLASSWQPRSAQIEMVAYTLLSLFSQAKIAEGFTLMKWLSEQRSSLGGYGSTQDTIIALQALSRYTQFSGSEAIDLKIKVSPVGSLTSINFIVDSTNYLQRQSQEIEPENTIHLNVTAEGKGFALFQMNVFYYVDDRRVIRQRSIAAGGEAFNLDVQVKDQDIDHLFLNICTSLRKGQPITQTGMALVQVGMLSGLSLVEDGIDINDIVRNVETPPGEVILYLDSVTTSQACFEIPVERDFKVAGVQEALVSVYDYYEPRRRVERRYNSEKMKNTSLSTFCGDNFARCSGSRPGYILSLVCILAILMAFIL
ncbi:hypothetical protein AGOR_G00110780 [Albula goreensis]|uniref:CD109 antigen-like n=1 Tax=Albula goreensis TaxID=1534307 RepID=A0A8T3DLD6_9TELE|nr:hypothetical protein AGOR_G00110780 [Albula goreensis]